MRKLATYALFALIAWWVVNDPAAAAHLVHSIGGWLSHAAASLSTLTSSKN